MAGARLRGMGIAAAAALAAGGALAAARALRAPPRTPPDAPAALLGGAVRFALPAGWEVQGVVREGGAEGIALYVPCPPLDPTPHSANVNLLAEPNAEGEDLAAFSARRQAVAAPRRVADERAEPGWRTVVSTGVDRRARYVVVERFGVSARGRVHAVAAFPCLASMEEAWFERTAAEVDRFLASLALDGAPPAAARVGWDGRSLRLDRAAGPALAARR